MLGAIAALTFLLFPLAAVAAACGCADDACPHHGGEQVPASRPLPSCHDDGPAPAAICNLVAPCPHTAAATSVLAHPPAVLIASSSPHPPAPEPAGRATSSSLPREIVRAVAAPPPRVAAL